MAGISIPSDSNVDQVLATLQSRTFLSAFIRKNNLLPILFEEIVGSYKSIMVRGNSRKSTFGARKQSKILKNYSIC